MREGRTEFRDTGTGGMGIGMIAFCSRKMHKNSVMAACAAMTNKKNVICRQKASSILLRVSYA
jgi:hypothetical protein